LRDAAEAEEATQDAFVKAYAALDRFRPDAAFRPWLLRIVTNEALNRRRGTWSRERLVQHLRQHDVSAATAPPPDASIDNAARRESLFRALAELPEPQRLTFVYRHILGMSEAETSDVLDTPVGTVKSRAARALDAIRGQLNEH
jgi:RNA polymerase sigma-70 factor (ECF subfamily)